MSQVVLLESKFLDTPAPKTTKQNKFTTLLTSSSKPSHTLVHTFTHAKAVKDEANVF